MCVGVSRSSLFGFPARFVQRSFPVFEHVKSENDKTVTIWAQWNIVA